jgi:hypothetical protein
VKTIAAPLYGSLGKHVNVNMMHFFYGWDLELYANWLSLPVDWRSLHI